MIWSTVPVMSALGRVGAGLQGPGQAEHQENKTKAQLAHGIPPR